MRLICPNCSTQYDVDASAIPAGGREVQCGICDTVWFQPDATAAQGGDWAAPDPADDGESIIDEPDLDEIAPAAETPEYLDDIEDDAPAAVPVSADDQAAAAAAPQSAPIDTEDAAIDTADGGADDDRDPGDAPAPPEAGEDDAPPADAPPADAPPADAAVAEVEDAQAGRAAETATAAMEPVWKVADGSGFGAVAADDGPEPDGLGDTISEAAAWDDSLAADAQADPVPEDAAATAEATDAATHEADATVEAVRAAIMGDLQGGGSGDALGEDDVAETVDQGMAVADALPDDPEVERAFSGDPEGTDPSEPEPRPTVWTDEGEIVEAESFAGRAAEAAEPQATGEPPAVAGDAHEVAGLTGDETRQVSADETRAADDRPAAGHDEPAPRETDPHQQDTAADGADIAAPGDADDDPGQGSAEADEEEAAAVDFGTLMATPFVAGITTGGRARQMPEEPDGDGATGRSGPEPQVSPEADWVGDATRTARAEQGPSPLGDETREAILAQMMGTATDEEDDEDPFDKALREVEIVGEKPDHDDIARSVRKAVGADAGTSVEPEEDSESLAERLKARVRAAALEQEAARQDAAEIAGEDEADDLAGATPAAVAAAAKGAVDRMPDARTLASSLRPRSVSDDMSHAVPPSPKLARNRFPAGFLSAIVLFALLAAAYVFNVQISERVPGVQGPLVAYAQKVDQLRDGLRGMFGVEASEP